MFGRLALRRTGAFVASVRILFAAHDLFERFDFGHAFPEQLIDRRHLVAQRVGRHGEDSGSVVGILRGGVHVDDVGHDFLDLERGIGGAAGDFLGGGHLLVGGVGDLLGASSDAADRLADLVDRADRVLARLLDLDDLRRNFLGRARGLVGQRLDLGGDDGKPLAGLAGAGGLDGRVQRQQIGLAGDLVDQADDIADFLRGLVENHDAFVRLRRLFDRQTRNRRAFLDDAGDFLAGRGQFLGGGGHGFDVGRRAAGGVFHRFGAAGRLGGVFLDRSGRLLNVGRCR